MASPTETQVQTKFKDVCKLVKSTINYGGVSGTPGSFDALQTTIMGDSATDYDAELEAAILGMRSQIDGAIRSGASVLSPVLRAYAKVTKFPETDASAILVNLYNWFVALYPGNVGVQTVISRQLAFGSVTSVGSPTGTGTIYRLTKDPYGYDLEACWVQQTIARCVQDQNLGAARHEERFEFRADASARDELIRLGSGTIDAQNFRSMSGRDSLLLNASFESCTPIPAQGGGSTPTANPTGWNLDVLANYQVTQDQYYRDYLGVTVGSTSNPPVALRFTTNGVITQLMSARQVPLQPLRPYFFQVPIYRESSADGTLTLSLGPLSPFTPTSAATAAIVLTAGNLGSGTYSYKISFVGPYGESIASAVSNTVTTDGTHQQVSLTGIPLGAGQNMTGSQSVIQRKVYRCAVGNAAGGPWLLVGSILDNFTTTFTDNVADGSLGAACLSALVTTKSLSTTISGLTNNAWSLAKFPTDENLYYKNWQANGLALTLTYTGRTTGSIVVDEVGCWPFQPFAGGWAVCVGGRTPWAYNDQYKWSDTALGSTCQEILWRNFGRYLPAVPAAPPATPTVAVADGAAGNVTAGSHVWAVTFVGNKAGADTTAAACKQESSPGANVTFVAAGAKHASLTAVPLGGVGITARRIYRSTAGTSTPLKFVGEIADNTTTTFDDNLADGSLGYTAPTGATILDT